MRALILLTAAPLFAVSLAGNAAQRAFVSTSGNDANAAGGCSVSAPCRSFDIAIGVVAGGGEVIAVDSGGYGRFSATKSVTVTAPAGVHAGISVFAGTNGIDINTAGVQVILRGLSISGQGGVHGIYFQNGASLVVENCTIDSMLTGSAIRVVAAGTNNAHPSLTYVTGTRVSGSAFGLQLSDGPASVTVSRSSFAGNGAAISARGTLAFVENSIAIADSAVANNGNGVLVSNRQVGALVGGGSVIETRGDNQINDNAQNVFGSMTSIGGT
jgi:hypothetical protein